MEEVKGRKPALVAVVTSGKALEDYVRERRAVGVADIGYTKMEQRYNTLQVRRSDTRTNMVTFLIQ